MTTMSVDQGMVQVPEQMASTLALGIDIGGTGIKGALVDVAAGALVGERRYIPTPQPPTPAAIA